jgi:uncharacterized membrane protein
MASKSKRARLATEQIKTKSIVPVLFWSLGAAFVGYLQNRYGQFSDIRGFYGMRFMDGQHHWPYESYVPVGAASPLTPIEYPALTGIVVWLLTFFVPATGNAIFNYFAINAIINAGLFAATAYFVRKLTDNKHTYFYIFAPAVVMALNLNWDLWAVVPMLASIYFFERGKFIWSAGLLGVGIAAKFFPVVLLLPITINLIRGKKFRTLARYIGITFFSWLIVNLPVMVSSFDGWKYFYTFSFSRGLGDGSIYSIFTKMNTGIKLEGVHYYSLNLLIFGMLIAFLVTNRFNYSLSVSAFLTMFAFTYFGKQYSMQYVIWLTPLMIICMYSLRNTARNRVALAFIIWQATEILFRWAYFQNLLTNVYLSRGQELVNEVGDSTYGQIAIIRYIIFLLTLGILVRELWKNQTNSISKLRK